LRAFADAGYEVVGASAPGPWVGDLTAWGIRHISVTHAKRSMALGQDLLALGELVRLFRAERPDIVHTHNPKTGVYGRVAARLAGVPVVVNTVHGLYATPDDPMRRRAMVYGLERAASTCSDVELVLSREDIATMRALRVPEHKLVELGGGIDLERFAPRSPEEVARVRRDLGIGQDQTVVGMVGRLVREKGFGEMFAAAQRLRHTRPDVIIVVVGPDDPAKPDALSAADRAVASQAGNVVFLGERKDVESLYPAFDIFALPSYREGFPLSAMEASACGVPVVATGVRGCRQVVEHGSTGLLVPARDADALAEAIENLSADRDRCAAMGRAARRRAMREFDIQRVIATTLAIYERLLSAKQTT
jgi:glycosyltransferase involved in cell wall biosynthesis